MAKLKARRRKRLPKSSFGQPGKRAYPMPDKSHARNAKARAAQQYKRGKLSKSAKQRIDAKANRVLGRSKSSGKSRRRSSSRRRKRR